MHSFSQFITELSNETLARYKKKAARRVGQNKKYWYSHENDKNRRSGQPFPGDNHTKGIKTAETKLKKHYHHVNEDAAVNSAGSGGVAGIGVGSKGEPGIHKKARTKMLTRLMPKKLLTQVTSEAVESGPGELRVEAPVVSRTKFAGQEVFQVPSEHFHKLRLGKAKYAHYRHYVGKDEVGQTIRDFGNKHYGRPIIVQDAATQHMTYLRYGKGK